MTRHQQISVAVGASVILLMLIFPPFHVQFRGTTFNMGYAFILDPPKRGHISASVNVGMLLVQWVGTLLLTALAFFTLKSSEKSGEGHVATAPSPLAEPPKREAPIDQRKSLLGGQHHPWRRFFARTVDVSTIGLLLFFLVAFTVDATMPAKAEGFAKALENPIIAVFLFYLVWIPAEAAFLALLGTTPAKWLFGIRVVHSNGESLSFSEALNRSFLVWVQGVGLGIPFVTLFTQLFAYRRLTKTGTTLWDTSTGAVVTHHQQWGVLRAIMCVAVVFAVLVLMGVMGVLINLAGNQPHG
ncbi:MAG: hypothetical protein DDT34_02310 [Firmicutes bacterium]|nr:hypothetical protein [Bacillota bacterium]